MHRQPVSRGRSRKHFTAQFQARGGRRRLYSLSVEYLQCIQHTTVGLIFHEEQTTGGGKYQQGNRDVNEYFSGQEEIPKHIYTPMHTQTHANGNNCRYTHRGAPAYIERVGRSDGPTDHHRNYETIFTRGNRCLQPSYTGRWP